MSSNAAGLLMMIFVPREVMIFSSLKKRSMRTETARGTFKLLAITMVIAAFMGNVILAYYVALPLFFLN